MSDKHLTENCDKLLPGDTILADRGFDIQESVGLFCATIKIPAQLTYIYIYMPLSCALPFVNADQTNC